jgi:hypothetical protein
MLLLYRETLRPYEMSSPMQGALGASWWQEHREKSADNSPQSKNQIILGKRMRKDCATFLQRKVI